MLGDLHLVLILGRIRIHLPGISGIRGEGFPHKRAPEGILVPRDSRTSQPKSHTLEIVQE
jgi:hypothetical protein